MAGLFGDLTSPANLPELSLVGSLLSGKRGDDVGLKVSNFANAEIQQQNQQRLNRANDLQQIEGIYATLKQQEPLRMMIARQRGDPNWAQPNPVLGQLEQRMAALSGIPNLSGGPAPASVAPAGGVPVNGVVPSAAGVSGGPSAPSNFGASAGPALAAPPQAQGSGPQPPQPSVPNAPTAAGRTNSDPFGGPAFGMDPLEMYSIDPTGQAYLKALLDQAKPLVNRNGVFGLNPQTGQVELRGGMFPINTLPVSIENGNPVVKPLPGQVETQGALAGATAGAEAGAKFPYRVEMVKQADGSIKPMLVSTITGVPGQSTPKVPQAPQQVPIPTPVQTAAASGKPFTATVAPNGQTTVTDPTQSDPMALLLSKVPPLSTANGVGQTTTQEELQKGRAKRFSDLSEQYSADADVANQRIATNNQALDLVNGADTGFFSGALAQYRNLLASIAPAGSQLAKDAADKAASDQALGKDLINTALTKGKQLFGSRFTQSEVGVMLSQASPSPQMQKIAIQFLLQTDNAQQQYNIQRGIDFNRYYQAGRDPYLFPSAYSKYVPLTNAFSKISLQAPAASADAPQISGLQVTFPSGNTMSFPSQTALQAWKKRAGIQ